MKSFALRFQRRRRGIVTVWLAMGMVPLVGLMGLALDFGNVAVRQARLQAFVDAKAIGVLKEQFGSPNQRVELEQFTNPGEGVGIQAQVSRGIWSFQNPGYTVVDPNGFVPNLQPRQVPAGRAVVDAFDVPLFFGPLFGIAKATLKADATAFVPRREIVIVQDVSGSMQATDVPGFPNRMVAAKAAVTTMLNLMANQRMPGDRVGLVPFDNAVPGGASAPGGVGPFAVVPLTNLAGSLNQLLTEVARWNFAGLTREDLGLQAGAALFQGPPNSEVERILILVGDGTGVPISQSGPIATAAFQNQGAHVFTILIGNQGTANFQALPRGRGNFRQSNGGNLTTLLTQIVTGVPMHLVD
jgi:hypothetical protein